MNYLKGGIRNILQALLGLFPQGTPEWLYRNIFSWGIFRPLTNWALKVIIPETIVLPEGVLFLNRKDPVVSGAIALSAYEPNMLKIFRSLLREGMTVLDIGANIGLYTLIAAKRVGPTGSVIAFEPVESHAALIGKTLLNNSLQNVFIRMTAASDTEGSGTLHLSSENLGKHSLVEQTSREFTDAITVPTERVDKVCDELTLSHIDIVKIDVEGFEGHVLRGMKKILERTDAPTILIEFSPAALRRAGTDPEGMLTELIEYGYTLHEISETTKEPVPIEDLHSFVCHFSGNEYTNVFAQRK